MDLSAILRFAEGAMEAAHMGSTNPTIRVVARVLEAAVGAARRLADGGMSVTDIVSEMEKIRPHNRKSIDTAIDQLASRFPSSDAPPNPDDIDTDPGHK